MKRTSIFGPSLLIVIGLLFLMNNLRPDLSVMGTIAQFWPFVLIAWGGIRMVEILITAMRGKPLPASGISGGEWALVFFISLIGFGAHVVNQSAYWWGPLNLKLRGVEIFGETYEFPLEEQKVDGRSIERIVVEHGRGNVRIVGTDTKEVSLLGRELIRALSRDEATVASEKTNVILEVKGKTAYARLTTPEARNERFNSHELELVVPKSVFVELHGRHGDFDVSDISNSVEVESDNAGVRLQNIGGSVRVDLRRSDVVRAVDIRGDVELKGRGNDVQLENILGQVVIAGAFHGELEFRKLAKALQVEDSNRTRSEIRVEGTPGELRIERGSVHGDNLIGPIVISARSKDVQLTRFTNSATINVDKGDINLQPGTLPLSRLEVSTRHGNIELSVPEGARFDMRGTARRGEVNNDFGEQLTTNEEGRGATLLGKVGEGPALVLTSDHGALTVRKVSAEALLTPDPPPTRETTERLPRAEMEDAPVAAERAPRAPAPPKRAPRPVEQE